MVLKGREEADSFVFVFKEEEFGHAMVTPTASPHRVANVAGETQPPGRVGEVRPWHTVLTSLSPCLWLTGTAPSINFNVCTWGHKCQLTTPEFPL